MEKRIISIDLNVPDELTLENVRKMIASADDSTPSQIRVTVDGVASVWDVRGCNRLGGVLFHSETYQAGNSYVGEDAANDASWVHGVYEDLFKMQRVYEDLRANWPNPKLASWVDGYELYLDQFARVWGPDPNRGFVDIEDVGDGSNSIVITDVRDSTRRIRF